VITHEPTGVRVITADTELLGRTIVAVKVLGLSGILYLRLSDKSGEDVLAAFEAEHDDYCCSSRLGFESVDIVGALESVGFIDRARFDELRAEERRVEQAKQKSRRMVEYEQLRKEFEPNA
jgi:hypothetical protein